MKFKMNSARTSLPLGVRGAETMACVVRSPIAVFAVSEIKMLDVKEWIRCWRCTIESFDLHEP